MRPRNIGCLTAARISCCSLANNHMLDWMDEGLRETVRTLDLAGIAHAGAGGDAVEAASVAALDVAGKGRVLVYSLGSPTSGIPWEWGATEDRPGVNLLEDLSEETARRIAGQMLRRTRPGDVTVASIHWGDNWGYHIPDEQIRFAHRLIEEGVSIVHGHSSHHVKAIEVYRERLILYGCGDFLTDYEGISGYEQFRGDLSAYVSGEDRSAPGPVGGATTGPHADPTVSAEPRLSSGRAVALRSPEPARGAIRHTSATGERPQPDAPIVISEPERHWHGACPINALWFVGIGTLSNELVVSFFVCFVSCG